MLLTSAESLQRLLSGDMGFGYQTDISNGVSVRAKDSNFNVQQSYAKEPLSHWPNLVFSVTEKGGQISAIWQMPFESFNNVVNNEIADNIER